MLKLIGLILACLAVLGALVLGYVAWRNARRKEDKQKQAQPSSGGGGPTKPVVPK